jgi:sugar lactone lactonase YvrE
LAALVVIASVVFVFLLRRGAPARPPALIRWPTVVTTLAGVGAPGLAEGRGHEVAFSDPFGLVVDAAGATYVADAGDNNVIWRIDPTGLATVIAGGREGYADGDGRAASFNTPSGIALDAAGNVIVADTGNNAIRRVSPAGSVTTVAGGGEAGRRDGRDARFDGPVGVAVAPDGAVVVADTYNDCIRRIAPDGTVTTIAGGTATGLRDATTAQALFDTPSGVAVDAAGVIYVADTGNDAIRRIGRDGHVTTIGTPGTASAPWQSPDLFRPVGIAIGCLGSGSAQAGLKPCSTIAGGSSEIDDRAPTVLVTDGARRVIALSAAGGVRILADRATGLRNPTGIAPAPDGSLRVGDSDSYTVCRLTRPGDGVPAADIDFTPVPWLTAATLRISTFPWPVDPQFVWHELAATLGEARGSAGGDGRERLHSGIDVRGPVGSLVRAVHDEKVERPAGATGFGNANESLRVGIVSYVHVRVGRTAGGTVLDPARFAVVRDEVGQVVRIRIRRGTRFHVGDRIGTINRLAHVHLGVGPRDGETNPLALGLEGFRDDIPPTIVPKGIELYSEAGDRIDPPRKGPVPVSGRVAIVVEAYDRVNGNDARRRLGVYRLGYQVLREDGTPAPGFGGPRTTIHFDRLPDGDDAPHLIYGEGSGITEYGNRTTRFRYIVTNSLGEGRLTQGLWETSQLPAGDYRLSVFAADYAGNQTTKDLLVRVQR